MPSSSRSAAIRWARRASPSMIGTIGCTPGRMAKPAAVIARGTSACWLEPVARASVDSESIARHASEALTSAGGSVFENR